MRASSEYTDNFPAGRNWRAALWDNEPWIQADIGYQTYVSGVATQGTPYEHNGVHYNYVTSFKVSTFYMTNDDDEVFVLVENKGMVKVNEEVLLCSIILLMRSFRFARQIDLGHLNDTLSRVCMRQICHASVLTIL